MITRYLDVDDLCLLTIIMFVVKCLDKIVLISATMDPLEAFHSVASTEPNDPLFIILDDLITANVVKVVFVDEEKLRIIDFRHKS